jgi:adenylate cyclase
VNKFEGDAALCVFGPPGDEGDHAGRALRAGLRLRDELAELADRQGRFDAGIGISSGVVVAGNVGAEERYEYTVIGDPVNEAARLAELAKTDPGRLVASGAVVMRAASADRACWRDAGEQTLRGRNAATAVYTPAELYPVRPPDHPAEPSPA